ncbi:hypothetical protein WMY93_028418 [Mugilogobius chulae]|uniref:Uncharacterized protein n=1 Tax=Mugilogobius chulae TaxID=88201 RepID=A0AAW0MX38_9GOBI
MSLILNPNTQAKDGEEPPERKEVPWPGRDAMIRSAHREPSPSGLHEKKRTRSGSYAGRQRAECSVVLSDELGDRNPSSRSTETVFLISCFTSHFMSNRHRQTTLIHQSARPTKCI